MVELSKENQDILLRLKQYFPYRIVFGVLYPDGKIEGYTDYNRRKMNKFARMEG